MNEKLFNKFAEKSGKPNSYQLTDLGCKFITFFKKNNGKTWKEVAEPTDLSWQFVSNLANRSSSHYATRKSIEAILDIYGEEFEKYEPDVDGLKARNQKSSEPPDGLPHYQVFAFTPDEKKVLGEINRYIEIGYAHDNETFTMQGDKTVLIKALRWPK